MDKAIMDKVNEVLRAHGKRELSMDEAAQVVGGDFEDTITINGCEMSRAEFNSIMNNLAKQYGFDTAAIIFEQLTNCPCYGNHSEDFGSAVTDVDKMQVALGFFWRSRRTGYGW